MKQHSLISWSAWAVALCCIVGCQSPESRLRSLQHEFWEHFARQDFFEIRLKNEVIHLALPPSADQTQQQQAVLSQLQREAKGIENEKLSPANQQQLAQLRAALDDLSARPGAIFFNPAHCTPTAQLKLLTTKSAPTDLLTFLEKIPAYYQAVEHRWQRPDTNFTANAIAQSQEALDLLKSVEKNIGREKTEEAKAAIKDFIGLCQSAVLE